MSSETPEIVPQPEAATLTVPQQTLVAVNNLNSNLTFYMTTLQKSIATITGLETSIQQTQASIVATQAKLQAALTAIQTYLAGQVE